MSLAFKLDYYRNSQKSYTTKKSLIDFIVEVTRSNDSNIMNQFIAKMKNGDEELQRWFSDNGYDISIDECKKIVENQKSVYEVDPAKAY